MRKRIISVLLALVLVLSLAPAAFAASDEANAAADALYQLGLFNGTGTDANGNPNFDLDRTPTRNEAVTMLVRLLGRAGEAESNTYKTPFADVAEWAKPYVGYAYANKLTTGTSATTYGGSGNVTATQYITFVLRALGYESGTDFQWDKAWELSDQLGITEGRYNANTTTFARGDVVIISHNALSCNLKGKDITLFEDLTARGAVKEHTHNYITKTVKHSEQVQVGEEQVQVGTEKYGWYTCKTCGFASEDWDEVSMHGVENMHGQGITTIKTRPVYETRPIYETQWVEETIKVCSICGQQYGNN